MLIKDKSVVGVACGGYGSEREISLKSGSVVYENLKKKYKIIKLKKLYFQVSYFFFK